jgi:hypothetical protein
MIFQVVYTLCAVMSLLCAGLLLRSYVKGKSRLLLWSSLCFVMLFVNNLLLFLDLLVIPTIDLGVVRGITSTLALGILVFGLVWDSR